MDYDGSNQKQLDALQGHLRNAGRLPDGKMFAFTTYAKGNPKIMVFIRPRPASSCSFTIRSRR